jgi:hypothetical protein
VWRKADGQLIAERDRLNKDLENAHSSIKALEVSLAMPLRLVYLLGAAQILASVERLC